MNKNSSSNLKNASNNRSKSHTSKKEKLDESTSTNSSNNSSKIDTDREEGEESSDSENKNHRTIDKSKNGSISGAEEGELDSDESDSVNPAKKIKKDNAESVETKIKKLNKLMEKFKSEYKNCEHKLSKIDRAIKKALAEGNKSGVKKCEKYKLKYESKLNQIKKKLKLCKVKLNELESNKQYALDKSTNGPNNDENTKPSNGSSNGNISKQHSELTKATLQTTATSLATTAATGVVKLPFPVLNDKRDKTTILGTLETKLRELLQKHQTSRKNIDSLNDQIRLIPQISSNANLLEKNHRQLDKLKQLDQLYESQKDKLLKQIEYIKLSLHIESLTSRTNQALVMNDMPYIQQLTNQLNDMFIYMKNENKLYLKKHQQQITGVDSEKQQHSTLSTFVSKNLSLSNLEQQQEPTMNRIRSLYDKTNHALASLLAHIAASAHASAAMYAYNMSYYQYYHQLHNKDGIPMPPKPPVPIKEEIEKASSAFAKFKSKISSFFTISQEIEKTTNTKMTKSEQIKISNVKKLIADYSDDSNDDDSNEFISKNFEEKNNDEDETDEMKLIKLVNNLKKSNEIRKKLNNTHKIFDDQNKELNKYNDEEELDDQEDHKDYIEELEIITTSEIKSGLYENRNYLLPSVKSSYFPMMSTLNLHESYGQQLSNVQIAIEKSSNALTLLGPAPNTSLQKKVKLSDILYGRNINH